MACAIPNTQDADRENDQGEAGGAETRRGLDRGAENLDLVDTHGEVAVFSQARFNGYL